MNSSVKHASRIARVAMLIAATPAAAQVISTPPPGEEPPPTAATNITVVPQKGQPEEQQWRDRYQCHVWARSQSGFDPTQGNDGAAEVARHREDYRRAFQSCLESRGYEVQSAPAAVSAPSAPAAAPAGNPPRHFFEESVRPPLSLQIEGGYTLAAGSTRRYLDDDANVGIGVSWFPSRDLPVGLRVDGSYSSFRARGALLDTPPGFTYGHENVYGGDVDLQLDLAPSTAIWKFYVFGGAGWYREQLRLRQITFVPGTACFYSCGPGLVPVVTAEDRSTSGWRSAWNAGLGWEVGYASGASFFVEARYLRIAPLDSRMQFVPIRVGVRF
jgi:hypothetical protein